MVRPKATKAQDEIADITARVLNDLQVAADQEDLPTLQRLLSFLDNHLKYNGTGNESLAKIREKASKLHQYWLNGLKVGDAVEVFWAFEDKWYHAKILSEDKDKNTVYLKYTGWSEQHNREINVISTPLNPPETFIVSKKKSDGMISWAFPEEDELIQEGIQQDALMGNSEVEYIVKETVDVVNEVIAIADTAEAPLVPEETTDSFRTRSRRLSNNSASIPDNNAKVQPQEKKTKKKKEEMDEVEDHNEWICSICKMIEAPQGSDLILCDGICRRSFHAECLAKKPKSNEDIWVCESCKTFNHECFLCNESGDDDIDVFKCSGKYCGKFYHLKCLGVDNPSFLPVKIADTTAVLQNGAARSYLERTGKKTQEELASIDFSSYEISITKPSFECPLHFCDTCYEHYRKRSFADHDELTPCSFCPRAFHTNCIPPGSRYNSVCLVCPLHPYQPLPDKARNDAEFLASLGGKGKKADVVANTASINNIRLLYDQLTIPDIIPDRHDPFENHFKLYSVIKDEIETTPKNFKLITKNNYSLLPPEKVPLAPAPDTGCDCRVACDERCFNRLSHIECCEMHTLRTNDENASKKVCTLGAHCGNRCFTNREYAEGIVFREGSMGLGLKAANYVSKGTLVIEYIGEVIDEAEMVRRLETQRLLNPSDRDYYVMELDHGVYVDGKYEGNVSRFINHSCNPNCILERWNVRGKIRIGIFAKRDIQPGEPFSYDYQFDTQEDDVFQCFCGATSCRGTMAPKKKERLLKLASTDNELRKKLIQQGKDKKQRVIGDIRQEELSRSYTNKYLPGDIHHEIKNGPSKGTFGYGQQRKLFLKRNILESSMLLLRKENLAERIEANKTTRGGRKSTRKSYITTNAVSSLPTTSGRKSTSSSSSSSAQKRKTTAALEDGSNRTTPSTATKKRKSVTNNITAENNIGEDIAASPVATTTSNSTRKRGKTPHKCDEIENNEEVADNTIVKEEINESTMDIVPAADTSFTMDNHNRKSGRAAKPNPRYAEN